MVSFNYIQKKAPSQTLAQVLNTLLLLLADSSNLLFLIRGSKNFSGQWRFRGIRAPQQTFCQNRTKKGSHSEKAWNFFFQIFLKLHFGWKLYSKDGQNQRIFFLNQGNLFHFHKKDRRGLPLPQPQLCACFFKEFYFFKTFQTFYFFKEF